MRHTPGPWQFSNRNWLDEVDPHGNLYITGNHGDGSCTAVARVEGNATAGAIPLANARLIAAAPELLAACQACVDQLSASSVCDVVIQKDQQPYAIKLAIAAIAKAVGAQEGADTTQEGRTHFRSL